MGGRHGVGTPDGSEGWDAYAAFYDWENARTMGRRDVAFWRRTLAGARGPVLELGCGTGRVLVPLARAGVPVAGVDRSAAMLARCRARAARLPRARRPGLARGDLRALPFRRAAFAHVIAPYGVLQSLTTDRDLDAALGEAARVLGRRGRFTLDLVPDLPAWAEYGPRERLRGRTPDGGDVRLVEAVRQDRRRGLTVFEETFVERRGGRTRRRAFTLTFRTLAPGDLRDRLAAAGFRVTGVFGDYRGGPHGAGSGAWVVRTVLA